MDCGSFSKKIVDVVAANSERFYIRAQRCASLFDVILQIKNWEEVEIGHKAYETSSIEYAPFGQEKNTVT